jgi:hypothetical protein
MLNKYKPNLLRTSAVVFGLVWLNMVGIVSGAEADGTNIYCGCPGDRVGASTKRGQCSSTEIKEGCNTYSCAAGGQLRLANNNSYECLLSFICPQTYTYSFVDSELLCQSSATFVPPVNSVESAKAPANPVGSAKGPARNKGKT